MPRKGLWVTPTQFIEFAGVKNDGSLANQIATRDKSIDFTALMGYLPNPDYILRKLGKDQLVYDEIKADGNVSSCISNRKAGVLSLKWAVNRGKSRSNISTFIEDIFNDLDMVTIMREILDAPLYGYRPMEIDWMPKDKYWIPRNLIGKPSRWFIFDNDDKLRMRTRSDFAGELMPENKFIVPRHEASYDNPYGEALLSKCFWPVTFKKSGLKFWVILAEKFGIPHLIGKHQPGASKEEIDALLDALEMLIQDAVAAIPNNADIVPLESGTKTASVGLFKDLLTYCKSEISLVILGQTLTSEIGDKGSYAAAKVHSEIRADIVDSDKRLVESVFNELIDKIVMFNFGDKADRPKFELYEEKDVDSALAERDSTLAGTGQVKFTKTYYMRQYGFAEDEIIIDESADFQKTQPSLFAAPAAVDPQEPIDELSDSLDDQQTKFAQELLKPVFELIEKAESYSQMLDGLAKLYPDLDTDALEKTLEKAVFLSETWGRLNARG